MSKKTGKLTFLSPFATIKKGHLSKQDVEKIKRSLSHRIGFAALIVAIILFLVSIISFISMGIETNWNAIEVYGLTSFLGQVVSLVGTIGVIALESVSLASKNNTIRNRFTHIASCLMFIVMIAYLFLSLLADASHHYLDVASISPSLLIIPLMILIQPVFWTEAIALDGIVSVDLIVFSIYASIKYHIQGVMYYIFTAVAFPVGCYLISSIFFYAEAQRYCEELRNEALFNHAIYDELTHCKNRYALKEALASNTKRWETNKEASLLVLMFDVDDFKQYNDQFTHIGGDYCLRTIADGIRKAFPAPSLDFYRYGGEEFLMFMEIGTLAQAEAIIEKIRFTVQRLCIVAPRGAPNQYVTISIGATFIKTCDTKDFDEVIKKVDEYLYEAKSGGKNMSVLDGRIVTKR